MTIISLLRHKRASNTATYSWMNHFKPAPPKAITRIGTRRPPWKPDFIIILYLSSQYKSCADILNKLPSVKGKDGVYEIYVANQTRKVFCDMTTEGGGWTGIQKRIDGSTDFYKTWDEYKKGFGNPGTNYWIGNDAIHILTKENQMLRVELLSFDGEKAYATYSTFDVGDEDSNYKLTIFGYAGTAGDSLEWHNGMMLSTKDRDNDVKFGDNCAVDYHGAWWFRNCHDSNLNGQYAGSALYNGKYPVWYNWKSGIALKGTLMMVKPKN
ncbi:ficolin-1-like [Ostrea edulis]|uniref:ficolin-1-like n=1 Tax=Ostrea edulis TaxID=37623 RepID=UPI0024AEC69B|nr:ficolin-1-like [Ostrea edulis]